MEQVNVLKEFTIRLEHEGQEIVRHIRAGVQHVEGFITEHWYAKAHIGPMPADVPDAKAIDDYAAAQAAAESAAIATAKAELQAESDRLEKLRVELDATSKGLDERAAALDMREAGVTASEQDLAARVAAFDAAQKDAASSATKDGATDGATQKSGSGKKA